MRFGVCGGPARFRAIVAAGAEYIEPAVAYDAMPENSENAWAEHLAQLRDSGLTAESWNCWIPSDLKIVGPLADWDRYRRYVHLAIPRLAAAGAQVVVMGSGGSRSVPEGYEVARALDDFGKAVRLAATAAAGAGITIAVEALHSRETNLLNTVRETANFVRALNVPNVRCTADFYHMEQEHEGVEALQGAGKLIGHAHLADTAREVPGRGTSDLGGFLLALSQAGYDGRVSIEANWHDFDSQIGPALKWLRDTWARVRASSAA